MPDFGDGGAGDVKFLEEGATGGESSETVVSDHREAAEVKHA